MTTDPITAWLNVIAPETGASVAAAIEGLPLRPVYPIPAQENERPYCAEWSIRSSERGIDIARLMVSVNSDPCQPGQLNATLNTIGGTSRIIRDVAEQLVSVRTDLDLLLGFALGESSPRAKLYVLCPAGQSIDDFADLSCDILAAAGISPDWANQQVELAQQTPAFFAIDLCSNGSASGKLYFSFSQTADADDLLRRLDATPLRETLDRVHPHISNNPTGRLVVTTRAEAGETTDITLHTHLADLPTLNPALMTAWERLQHTAARHGLPPLHWSYASWLWGPRPSESLYYTFVPPPA